MHIGVAGRAGWDGPTKVGYTCVTSSTAYSSHGAGWGRTEQGMIVALLQHHTKT